MTIRYPHRIRLRGPWECAPLERRPAGELPPPMRMTLPCRWAAGGLADFAGVVRFRRRFGYPGQIDAWERVWLTFEGASDRAAVRLNGRDLGDHAGDAPFECEATALLQARNELIVDVAGPADGGLWGETALEVRCTAFLRHVRFWVEGTDLHAAGLVVGEADRPLDLYVLLGGATAAYVTVAAAPAGTPFHIVAEKAASGQAAAAQVDLVNGAVVWYTAVHVLPAD
ncbi:MAG TPA: hypothetical protein VMS17_00410 [Gemmataceae bacterium]|nr:hypothetical protein [Gemmataceae bacterium]